MSQHPNLLKRSWRPAASMAVLAATLATAVNWGAPAVYVPFLAAMVATPMFILAVAFVTIVLTYAALAARDAIAKYTQESQARVEMEAAKIKAQIEAHQPPQEINLASAHSG